uniref:AlNc14C175G8108 protein n=1 Tax=Albugo laibachii Nc14 TaxID=890382 RepID=F0WNU8_9STRA|nr:AlNc14C175G8108 [Albugo laibachii Nc14]|eukprot:CCA22991.1 AlNc14C175G8108 [Albugo laibachii Nc14]
MSRSELPAMCIWITNAEPAETLSMAILAKSDKLQERCPAGLHAGVVYPNNDKLQRSKILFQEVNDFVKIYPGATSILVKQEWGLKGENTEFNDFLREQLSKDLRMRMLITAQCTDLALAIIQSANLTVLDKIDEIYWAGGFDEAPKTSSLLGAKIPSPVHNNSYRDTYATRYIAQFKKLRHKIAIVSKTSYSFGETMNIFNSRKVINKLTYLNSVGVEKINWLLRDKEFWPGNVATEPRYMAEVPRFLEGVYSSSGIQVRSDAFVAAMVMFYPEFIHMRTLVKYSIVNTKTHPDMDFRRDLISERELYADCNAGPMNDLFSGKYANFYQCPYEHTLVKTIDIQAIENTVLSLLAKYNSRER